MYVSVDTSMYVDAFMNVYTHKCVCNMKAERGYLEGGRGPRTDEEDQCGKA